MIDTLGPLVLTHPEPTSGDSGKDMLILSPGLPIFIAFFLIRRMEKKWKLQKKEFEKNGIENTEKNIVNILR
jgi:hypothetical protein